MRGQPPRLTRPADRLIHAPRVLPIASLGVIARGRETALLVIAYWPLITALAAVRDPRLTLLPILAATWLVLAAVMLLGLCRAAGAMQELERLD